MIDNQVVGPVELDTDLAGIANVVGAVVELVNGNGQLQPGRSKHHCNYGAVPLSCIH